MMSASPFFDVLRHTVCPQNKQYIFPYPDYPGSSLWPKEAPQSQIHKEKRQGLSCLFKVPVQVSCR